MTRWKIAILTTKYKRAALALIVALAALLILARGIGASTDVKLTYYLPTGNRTASGVWPYAGSAACSPDLMPYGFGTLIQFEDTGEIVSCEDTGSGVLWRHVDRFVYSHGEGRALIATYGERTRISIIGED